MKLTDEMRAAIAEELDISVEQLTIGAEDAFRVGYRMGQQAMRERAAKDCLESMSPHGPLLAAAIRALSTEE